MPYWKRFERPQGSSSTSKKSEAQREKEKLKPAPEPLLNEPEFNHIARLQLPIDDD
ncbi:MAG: hypothetical protein HC771_01465 [Synechococcales cyanobacterium CRU_2_2]|nr:hypothetical protein [Synechococcales cyanobacterium CRU_2_2]